MNPFTYTFTFTIAIGPVYLVGVVSAAAAAAATALSGTTSIGRTAAGIILPTKGDPGGNVAASFHDGQTAAGPTPPRNGDSRFVVTMSSPSCGP